MFHVPICEVLDAIPVYRNNPWCSHNWVCGFADKIKNSSAASITVRSQVSDLLAKYWN